MGEGRRRLVWSADADNDLTSIWRSGAEQWSDEIAESHLFEIECACERLLHDPLLGKARDDLLAGLRSIPMRPHVIYYQISKLGIEIVRVLHQRMEIESIFDDA
jgi:toxin ParE1/3/4